MVLLFHLEVESFQFGYIGVDIFFIISGFLMPIILPKYGALDFIKARVTRLMPALSATIFVTIILGYYLLLPGEYYNLSISALSAYLFSSQFYFIANTGYFDQDAIYQPLLHTWSLGSEFLAYIIVFIFILVLPKRNLNKACVIIILLSLFYTLYYLSFGTINYLDPTPRILLFFCAFLVANNKHHIHLSDRTMVIVSAISLFFICAFFSEEIGKKIWPNYSLLLFPSFIIPLMLMKRSLIPISILNKTLHKIGDWSYSIYIWHWVIICFERIALRNANISNKEAILLFVLSIIVGGLSFTFIERKKKLSFFTLILSIIFIFGIFLSDGVKKRVPEELYSYASVEKMIDDDFYISENTVHGINIFDISHNNNDKKTLIIGDSHSRHILPIYKSSYPGSIYRVSLQPSELISNWKSVQRIISEYSISDVLFAYRFSRKKTEDISILIDKINLEAKKSQANYAILRDIPSFNGDPVACLFSNETQLLFKSCGFDIKSGLPIEKVYNDNDSVWDEISIKASDKIKLIDTHHKMCNKNLCLMEVDGTFIMRDNNHFNEKMPESVNKLIYNIIF